jgi:hypothetical protein
VATRITVDEDRTKQGTIDKLKQMMINLRVPTLLVNCQLCMGGCLWYTINFENGSRQGKHQTAPYTI